jgi:hypothetical protein
MQVIRTVWAKTVDVGNPGFVPALAYAHDVRAA